MVAGKTCWVLCIDALMLSIDGSLLDALSIAIRVLLTHGLVSVAGALVPSSVVH